MNLVGENLSYKLTEELQLRKISFNFEKGKLYTILGRTLSGKTTLLKTIAGLLMPDSGSIRFEDKNFLEIPVWKRNIAMVYQQFINYPHLNVFDNTHHDSADSFEAAMPVGMPSIGRCIGGAGDNKNKDVRRCIS